MNNQRDIQIFELANRLMKLDVTTLSEQQLQHRNDMILKLKEEIKMLDEASLAQMRDYFKATDPKVRSISPTAKYVANTDPNAQVNMQKRFRSQAEYEEWLEKNGLKQISGIKKEGITDTEDAGEYDQEGDMAKQDLATAANAAEELRSILDSDENLPEWVQSKITKAVDYLDTVRDYMKSKDQGVSEGEDRVDTLVTRGLEKMTGPRWLDAVAAIKAQVGERDYRERKQFYDFFVQQLVDRYGKKGVAEGYDPVESDYQQWEDILVKDGYRGDPSGAYALKLVVGHQRMSDPAEVASTIRNILTYVKQNRQVLGKAVSDRTTVKDAIIDIKNKFPQQYQAAQQPKGVAEAGFPGAPDVEMPPMKSSGDPQRDKLKQEYMDLHREIKSLVDIPYSSNSSPEQKMQAKARIKQLNDRADQIKAILEPRQPPNEWQKKTYGYDDNWNRVGKGVTETKKPSPKLTPVEMKKSEPVSEEINTEAYERLQKVFAFKNYES
jgi:hypothetical protein